MKPIVHGLEQRYGSEIDFVYLNVNEDRTVEAQRRYDFRGTPQFVFLDKDGHVMLESLHGVVSEAELIKALETLLTLRQKYQ